MPLYNYRLYLGSPMSPAVSRLYFCPLVFLLELNSCILRSRQRQIDTPKVVKMAESAFRRWQRNSIEIVVQNGS